MATKKAGKKKATKKKAAKKKIEIKGRCLCGAVRYACRQAPFEVLYCHCRKCQRASGAPVVAWAGFDDPEAFSYTKGAIRIYHSSKKVQREFCGDCGSQLVWRRRTDGYVGINVGTLNDPGQVAPRDSYHMCTESQLAWFEVADELDRY